MTKSNNPEQQKPQHLSFQRTLESRRKERNSEGREMSIGSYNIQKSFTHYSKWIIQLWIPAFKSEPLRGFAGMTELEE